MGKTRKPHFKMPVRNGANPIGAALQRAADMDRRRQLQAENQAASINRLLSALTTDGQVDQAAVYTAEMVTINTTLAATQFRLEQANGYIAELAAWAEDNGHTLPEANVLGGTEQD